jgi:hypothetical protein
MLEDIKASVNLKNNNGFETKSQIKIIAKYMSIIKEIMFKVSQNKKNDLAIGNVCRIIQVKVLHINSRSSLEQSYGV